MELLALREPVSALSHGVGLMLSLPIIPLFWRLARGNFAKRVSLMGYNLSMAVCFGSSALFHSVRGPNSMIEEFNLLDHLGIYLYIAGSYTCVIWNLLQGRLRRKALIFTWVATTIGIVLQLWYVRLPPMLQTSLYLVLGWGGALIVNELSHSLPPETLRLLLRGGFIYSVGAAIFVLNWPNLWPGVFESHELFHLVVLAGSLEHFLFILRAVVPDGAEAPVLAGRPALEGKWADARLVLHTGSPGGSVTATIVMSNSGITSMTRRRP